MKKLELIGNRIFIVFFATTMLGALIGAIFCGATHQLFVAGICFLLILMLRSENRKISRKDENI
jgi:hypothetical protein